MSLRREKRWTAADARMVLERIEREGSSIPDMAKQLGVTPQRIYWWRHRLEDEEPSRSDPEGDFVEVTLSMTQQPPMQGFVLHLGDGRRIEIPEGFDGHELSRLLSVVEAAP